MSSENNRIGFYYYPDDQHYTQSDLKLWLPALQSMSSRWLTLQGSPDRAIPETFVLGLAEVDIEPIIHMPGRIGSVSSETIMPLLNSYARWGVRHVIIHDRPNLKSSWDASEWSRPGLVERFVDHILPLLKAQASAGLKPVLPPLEPGGDYWDTAFLDQLLRSLVRRGEQALLEELVLGIYAWTYGKSIDWGKGGPSRWPEARPYHTPPECEDQIGFRAFDWYKEIACNVIQKALPMVVVAGGEIPTDKIQGLGPDPHAERNLAIARALSSDEVPPEVMNFAFYHLASFPDHTDNDAAWYLTIDQPKPVVSMIQRLVNTEAKQVSPQEEKPLKHYVLLPPRPSPQYTQNWEVIGPFVLAVQPVVGFSPREASLAERVTLFGDEQAIPQKVEQELRASGCNVRRFTGTAARAFLTKNGSKADTDQPILEKESSGDPNA
jgi:hypothetical protein